MQEAPPYKHEDTLTRVSLFYCVAGFIGHFLIFIAGNTPLILIPLFLNGVSLLLAGLISVPLGGTVFENRFLNLLVVFCFIQQILQYLLLKRAARRLSRFVIVSAMIVALNLASGLIVYLIVSFLRGFA